MDRRKKCSKQRRMESPLERRKEMKIRMKKRKHETNLNTERRRKGRILMLASLCGGVVLCRTTESLHCVMCQSAGRLPLTQH